MNRLQVVLNMLDAFVKEVIKPFVNMPSKILKNMNYFPWFKDCIGAIDRPHIPPVVPTEKVALYRSGWKHECTQNFMFSCLFDMLSHGYSLNKKDLP